MSNEQLAMGFMSSLVRLDGYVLDNASILLSGCLKTRFFKMPHGFEIANTISLKKNLMALREPNRIRVAIKNKMITVS